MITKAQKLRALLEESNWTLPSTPILAEQMGWSRVNATAHLNELKKLLRLEGLAIIYFGEKEGFREIYHWNLIRQGSKIAWEAGKASLADFFNTIHAGAVHDVYPLEAESTIWGMIDRLVIGIEEVIGQMALF